MAHSKLMLSLALLVTAGSASPCLAGREGRPGADYRAINQLLAGTGVAMASNGNGGTIILISWLHAALDQVSYSIGLADEDTLSVGVLPDSGALPGVTVDVKASTDGEGLDIVNAGVISSAGNLTSSFVDPTAGDGDLGDHSTWNHRAPMFFTNSAYVDALNRLTASLGVAFEPTGQGDAVRFQVTSPLLYGTSVLILTDDSLELNPIGEISIQTDSGNGGTVNLTSTSSYSSEGSLESYGLIFDDGSRAEGAALPGVTVTLKSDGTADIICHDIVVTKDLD